MGLHENFGRNLTRLTAGRGSANFVARRIGIDIRLFRRYLAGETLPQPDRLRLIARYFGVSDAELLADVRPPSLERDEVRCREALDRARTSQPSLDPGMYRTWFWTPEHAAVVVGALTIVRHGKDGMTFRRLTAAAERKGTRFSYVKGDHQGFVTDRLDWIYFVGSNRRAPHEPTIVTVRRAMSAHLMFAGHGMVMTQAGPTYVTAVMIPYSKEVGLRRAFKEARSYRLEDPTVGEQVSLILRTPPPGWSDAFRRPDRPEF